MIRLARRALELNDAFMPTLMFQSRMGARSREIHTFGQRVHVLEAGPEDGEPLVLVHGAAGGAGWFWRSVPALARAGRRVILPDMPGYGESSRPAGNPPVSFAWYGEFLDHLLEAMDLSSVDLVGQSMGGGLCLSLALERPSRVRRLVLVASAALGNEIAIPFKLMAVPFLRRVVTLPHPRVLRNFHANFLYGEPGWVDEEMLLYDLMSQSRPGSIETLLSMVHGAGSVPGILLFGQHQVKLVDRLGTLKPPCLIIWGLKDRIVPVQQALEAARRIPNVRLELIPEAGHMPHFETPERFTRALLGFFEKTRVLEMPSDSPPRSAA